MVADFQPTTDQPHSLNTKSPNFKMMGDQYSFLSLDQGSHFTPLRRVKMIPDVYISLAALERSTNLGLGTSSLGA